VFSIVVTITFQNVFHLKMYQNNIFFQILKFIFDISIAKWSINTKKNYDVGRFEFFFNVKKGWWGDVSFLKKTKKNLRLGSLTWLGLISSVNLNNMNKKNTTTINKQTNMLTT